MHYLKSQATLFHPVIQLEKWTHTKNSPKTHLEQMERDENQGGNKKIRCLYYMMARCNPLKPGNNSHREMRYTLKTTVQ